MEDKEPTPLKLFNRSCQAQKLNYSTIRFLPHMVILINQVPPAHGNTHKTSSKAGLGFGKG